MSESLAVATLAESPRTAAATEAAAQLHADRAIDDPVKLARAARIIRTALARKRLTIDDLTANRRLDGVA